jgi:hypothetical protein
VLQVKITGAGPPITKDPHAEPKVPPPSPPTMPPMPSPPPLPPPSSLVSEPTPQSYSLPPLPKCLPSVFDKKPKKKGKKKKKKKKKPPPPPSKPIECCDDDVCGNQGQLPSIFAICHIPATLQGQGLEDDYGGDGKKEDRSSYTSSCSQEENEGYDIPPAVRNSMRPDEFVGIFGKEIDARNLAEVGPHGWHPTANAPYDITDIGDHGLSGFSTTFFINLENIMHI